MPTKDKLNYSIMLNPNLIGGCLFWYKKNKKNTSIMQFIGPNNSEPPSRTFSASLVQFPHPNWGVPSPKRCPRWVGWENSETLPAEWLLHHVNHHKNHVPHRMCKLKLPNFEHSEYSNWQKQGLFHFQKQKRHLCLVEATRVGKVSDETWPCWPRFHWWPQCRQPLETIKKYINIWQCVKTHGIPCSSHQNSWDLWMWITH